MQKSSIMINSLKGVTGVLFILWAGIHIYLANQILRVLSTVGYFFLADSILALIAAMIVIVGIRTLYIPVIIYTWINYLLLTESRIFPAPVLGFSLPVYNEYVYIVFGIDIILI
ncbi:hypothetical protein, partial [Acidianus sp. RZ1]|uniref:hypothetical protein n=1 Tax=Acidianus sp. RZ1 TaxID=1540082 RepID=UPI001C10581B